MRPIAFILSVLVLFFSCLPCADRDGFTGGAGGKVVLTEKHGCPADANGGDDCSPFCTCNCCAGFSVNHTIAMVTIANRQSDIPKKSSFYLQGNTIEVSLPVWQPPQA